VPAVKPSPKPRPRKRIQKRGRARLSAPEIIRLLGSSYGPFQHASRLDPAEEVVLTILSQHTSDYNSERAFHSLMREFGSLDAVADGDIPRIERAIQTGGLARVKAPRIRQILNLIKEKRGNLDLTFLKDLPLPEAKAWLRSLPGIGPKSAAVILCFSLGMPAMAVDTHVHRVSKRLGLIGPKVSADDAHDILEAMVEPDDVYPFHVALITHGRKVCHAQRPRCAACVLAPGCPSAGIAMKKPPKKKLTNAKRSGVGQGVTSFR